MALADDRTSRPLWPSVDRVAEGAGFCDGLHLRLGGKRLDKQSAGAVPLTDVTGEAV